MALSSYPADSEFKDPASDRSDAPSAELDCLHDEVIKKTRIRQKRIGFIKSGKRIGNVFEVNSSKISSGDFFKNKYRTKVL
jgi:hypothetical protein